MCRLLQPVRNGASSYRKVLLIGKESQESVKDIAGHSLAMTSMGPESETILNTVLFSVKGIKAKNINRVIVPKDSDALFALALGQVDMAFVGTESMERIGKINPRILQAVRPLIESAPIPGPVLCYTEGAVSSVEVEKFKEIFLSAAKKTMRSKIMEMLRIDDWHITN